MTNRTHARVPALDLTPAGHLPHLVDSAREHTEPEVDFAQLVAALPAVVDRAMRKTLPAQYTPQVAAQIAAGMISRLAAPDEPLTPEQSTLVLDDGLGARTTAPVETELRDIDSDRDPDLVHTPFLAAQVVVSEYRPQAYGRTTRVWLSHGKHTGELSPAEARQALEALRAFLPRLEAVVALAEQEAAGDFDGDPEIARLDREAEDRRIRAITEGRAGGAR
ncbi:hypothetical protein [Streptomyces sp. NPDC020996]|uniref:hypothetical protein n=1 Tax=Streptomyces sp. NPDC020996 TaxID=3154791 RepID=UPI0033BFD964